MRGRFIVIEGIDGSGKSMQTARLVDRHSGWLLTAEPTDNVFGKMLRAVLRGDSDAPGKAILPWLFAVDRAHHLDAMIDPVLESGMTVICDRYIPSSLAYQPTFGDTSFDTIWSLNKGFRVPDLVIWLDVTVPIAIGRIEARNLSNGVVKRDLFESAMKLAAVREAYQEVFSFLIHAGWNVVHVDGTRSAEEVESDILSAIQRLEVLE